MKLSLTTSTAMAAAAIGLFLAFIASAAPLEENSFLARSFPEKVGSFTRVSVKKNDAVIHGDVIDAAVAKYVSGASQIEWTGTAFATSDKAFEALETMVNSYKKDDAGVSSVKNVEGKIRYAVIETKDKIVCCWVNKQRKNLFFVASGQQPEIKSFMQLQTTW